MDLDFSNPLFNFDMVPLELKIEDDPFSFIEMHPFDMLLDEIEPNASNKLRGNALVNEVPKETSKGQSVDVNANVFAGHKRERERDANSNYIDMNSICKDLEPPSPSLVRSKSPRLLDSVSIGKASPFKVPQPVSPMKIKTKPNLNSNNSNDMNRNSKTPKVDYSLWNFEPDDGLKRRGRPRKSAPMREQDMEDVVPDTAIYDSVKKIPCFFAKCTHAYHRPGSAIVERSDRMLVLDAKYDGYTLRTCKKHHEVWKKLTSHSRSTCEVCRGLNCDDENRFQKQDHSNTEGRTFRICDTCASRQRVVLKLPDSIGIEN